MEEVYARETVLLAKYPDTVKVKLQAMRIGELGDRRHPVRGVHRDRAGDQEAKPAQADVHDRAGERVQRLPADAGPARNSAGTRRGGPGRATWRRASDKIVPVVLRLLGKVAGK